MSSTVKLNPTPSPHLLLRRVEDMICDPFEDRQIVLMAFFTIELTQGPNLRFPNLHVTHNRLHKGPHEGPGSKAPTC